MLERRDAGGWIVGRSIALELDTAIAVANDEWLSGALPEEIAEVARLAPPAWREQWAAMFGAERSGRSSVVAGAARLAGALTGDDYDRATLAARELTIEQALARLAAQAEPYGLSPDAALPAGERLVDLGARLEASLYAELGFAIGSRESLAGRAAQELRRVARVLHGGDLHGRFWHWVDRFYFEIYRPWRERREPIAEMQESRAVAALGGRERDGAVPALDWLPPQNPLLRYPELRAAVEAGKLRVLFVAEPFGMSDLWGLYPGLLAVTFAAPGPIYRQFHAFAADVAGRVQALADPTRLTILRLIRHFGAINTEIAEYLELARPTVSVHAKILREAGLIRSRQEGRQMRHEIDAAEVRRLFRDLEQFLDLPEE
jgi:ArsR family transcriptional regulator